MPLSTIFDKFKNVFLDLKAESIFVLNLLIIIGYPVQKKNIKKRKKCLKVITIIFSS